MIGHSLGELACANADNCMTLEETILASYSRGRASNEAPLIKGMMAAIGKIDSDSFLSNLQLASLHVLQSLASEMPKLITTLKFFFLDFEFCN